MTPLALYLALMQPPQNPPALWYDRPATEYMSGLPVGSGRLGAMVLGKPGEERVALNHNRLWRGARRNRPLPNGKPGLDEFRRLMLEGKILEANQRASKLLHWQYEGVDDYQPAGDLLIKLDLDEPKSDYRRRLDLSTGIVTTTYTAGGIRFRQETFASRPDNVIVHHLSTQTAQNSGEPAILGEIELSRISDPDCKIEAFWDGESVGFTGRFPEGIEFTTAAAWLGEKGETISLNPPHRPGARTKVESSRPITLLISVAVSESGSSREQAESILERAVSRFHKDGGYQSFKESHIAAHRKLFDRVKLTLPDKSDPSDPTDKRLVAMKAGAKDPSLQALYFHYGRYLLISSSAPGGLPANLQGIWNEDLKPPWWSDYHTNINLNMNYWHAESANLSECHDPLFDWVDKAAKEGEDAARAYFGTRGTWIAQSLDAWAINRKQPGAWTEWTGAAPWLAQHYWWRYEFTGDRDFLRNRAYPIFKAVAAFFEDFLIPDSRPKSKWNGRLVTIPSTSPENAYLFEGKRVDLAVGSTMDFQLIYDLLTHAIKASEILGVDTDKRAEWKRILERIPPLQIGIHGQIQEWLEDHEEAEPGHRHFSHLFGLFPGDQITLENTPQFAAAAKKSIERRLSHKGGHTGWSRSWLVGFYARLQNGNAAEEHLRHLIADFATISLLDLHPPRIFQIDGNFGGTAGITEMLLQSHKGIIRLLPGLPEAWHSGNVSGLVARGAVEVGIRWDKGRAVDAALLSRRGGRHVIRAPKGQRIYTISVAGKPLHLSPTGRTSAEVAVNLPAGKTASVRFSQEKTAWTPPKGYVCYRAPAPLKIDGKLADSAWRSAPWTDAFVDIEGDLKPRPGLRTRAKMLWDDKCLYIGASLEEPHVWATLTKRDSVIFHDNDFEFFIEPDGDNHNYYEGEINALNTFWDLRLVKPYRDGGPALNSWDIKGLKTAVHVQGTLNNANDTDSAWSLEIAIPWKALGEFTTARSPPRSGDQWRINFSRVQWRTEIQPQPKIQNPKYTKIPGLAENNWVWSPQGIIDMHRPERWGYLQFSTARHGNDRVRPDPSCAAREVLQRIYAAQKEFFEANGRWADTLDRLAIQAAESVVLTTDSTGFSAAVNYRDERGKLRTCRIRQDSRIVCQ